MIYLEMKSLNNMETRAQTEPTTNFSHMFNTLEPFALRSVRWKSTLFYVRSID